MSDEILLALAFVVVSVIGLVLVRRRVPLEQLVEHHEVAGVCFAVVGGLYGILLAFVLVSSWERYESARAETEYEASAVADLYRHAGGFSEPTQSRLRVAALAYIESTVKDDWPAMAEDRLSEVSQARYVELWNAVIQARPTDSREIALYQSTLGKLDDFADARRHRIFYMVSGLPGLIWVFLIVFGTATVGFTYLFGMPRLLPQVAITVVLAATIAWSLVLVHETQTPFSNILRVTDRAFQIVLTFIHEDTTRRGHGG